MLENYLQIHHEIRKCISSSYPVIALQVSAIIESFPYPKNLKIFNNICSIIRNNGAIPATTAIINGKLKVGLTDDDIELLVNTSTLTITKEILPFAISNKLTGFTDILTTSILANWSEINVLFITDRNLVQNLKYIEYENMVLIWAGLKSSNTLQYEEYLNKNNINLIKYEDNNLKENTNINKIHSSLEVSKYLKIKWDLNLKGGTVVSHMKENNLPNDYEISLYENADLASKIGRDLSNLYNLK